MGSPMRPPGLIPAPPHPQVHGDNPLAPPRLPLHVSLGEHVEHGQHLQHEHGDGRGRWVTASRGLGGICRISDAKTPGQERYRITGRGGKPCFGVGA